MTARQDAVTRALVRARQRLSDPQRWTGGVMARNEDGECVSPWDEGAVAWCAVGALRREEREDMPGEPNLALERLSAVAHPRTIFAVNDVDGHAAVLALYDEAIRRK